MARRRFAAAAGRARNARGRGAAGCDRGEWDEGREGPLGRARPRSRSSRPACRPPALSVRPAASGSHLAPPHDPPPALLPQPAGPFPWQRGRPAAEAQRSAGAGRQVRSPGLPRPRGGAILGQSTAFRAAGGLAARRSVLLAVPADPPENSPGTRSSNRRRPPAGTVNGSQILQVKEEPNSLPALAFLP